jgi:ABC-type lipoprotein release transport system permease subunit
MAMVEVPGHGSGQLSLRGVTLAALEVHRQVRLIDGGWARSGEVMAGVMAHHALGLKHPFAVDDTVVIEDQELRVAGIFDAAGTVAESEIWLNRSDLNTLVQRETLSSVVVKLEDPDAFASVDLFAKRRLDLELSALPERRYYGNVEAFYRPVRGMVWLTAVLIAIGAVMGGLNMLYAAYSARIRELATLQTLGFSRPALLWTLIQESLLTQLLGLACAVLLMRVLLEGHVVRFSLGAFQLETGQGTLWAGISTALLLGTIGTLPPALRCLRMPLPAALRAS